MPSHDTLDRSGRPSDEEPVTEHTYRSAVVRHVQQDVVFSDAMLARALRPLGHWTEGRNSLIVTTPTVNRLYREVIAGVVSKRADILVLDCDESRKDLAHVERVCSHASSVPLNRGDLLVGIGGGVCTDITTVAAAWIRRGIDHVRVPTTLVGQVDAGIGHKGAINFRGYKSYLGSFHGPRNVLIAPKFLQSLSPKQLREGFAEIVKIAIVCDPELLEFVEQYAEALVRTGFRSPQSQGTEIVWRAATRMLEELEDNPFEDRSFERPVDFGHTFSPLLESASAHRLSHGEAVAIDMALTMAIATTLGLTESTFEHRVLTLLTALGLPIYCPLLSPELCDDALQQAARHRGGRPNLVLPTKIGATRFLESVEGLDRPVLAMAINRLAERIDATTGMQLAVSESRGPLDSH